MRPACLENDQVPSELTELCSRVKALRCRGRRAMVSLCDELADWAQGMQRLVEAAHGAVAQLQLDAAYLSFDRKWTRRERDDLRAQLEKRGME